MDLRRRGAFFCCRTERARATPFTYFPDVLKPDLVKQNKDIAYVEQAYKALEEFKSFPVLPYDPFGHGTTFYLGWAVDEKMQEHLNALAMDRGIFTAESSDDFYPDCGSDDETRPFGLIGNARV